ncbi:MAG: hypothetical protein HY377_02245 [Candidatus Blackburnbacteria bacterium]|nr:hypothetical protein [Candidatus Blackburnbacteria bacterium]
MIGIEQKEQRPVRRLTTRQHFLISAKCLVDTARDLLPTSPFRVLGSGVIGAGGVLAASEIAQIFSQGRPVMVAEAAPNLVDICRNVVVKAYVRDFEEANNQAGYQEGEDKAGSPIRGAKAQWKVNGQNTGAVDTTGDDGLAENRFEPQPCNAENGTKLTTQAEITTPDGRSALRTFTTGNGNTGSYIAWMQRGETLALATATPERTPSPTTTPATSPTATATRTPEKTATPDQAVTVTATRIPEKTPTATATATVTASPTSTSTETATPTPTPSAGGGIGLPDLSSAGSFVGGIVDVPARVVDQVTGSDIPQPFRAGVDIAAVLALFGLLSDRPKNPRTRIWNTFAYIWRFPRYGLRLWRHNRAVAAGGPVGAVPTPPVRPFRV